jgi:osmotically-inducible protein OsmY
MINKDEILRLEVMDELRWEPRIGNPATIGVAVSQGIVTLSGYVDNYSDAVAAAVATARVPEVEGIIQNIVVRLPAKMERDDLEIARQARSAIDLNSVIPSGRVKVVVKEGWVTLTGNLELEHQKEEAESTVSKIEGIKGLTNKIVVKPKLESMNIKAQIEKAFQQMAGNEARKIAVEMKDGEVTLSGFVRDTFEIEEAEKAVLAMPGVKKVINKLALDPFLGARKLPV